MKKNILIALLLLVSVGASAQLTEDTKGISWNAKAGLNFNSFVGKDGKTLDGISTKTGYYLGVGMEYSFNKTWAIQPSLLLSSKGAKESGITYNALYLELPVMAAARIRLTDKIDLVFNLGPYFAIGVGGKTKIEADNGEYTLNTFSETEMPLLTEEGVVNVDIQPMKRFDVGVGLGIAVEFGSFVVAYDSKLGFINVGGYIKGGGSIGLLPMNFRNQNLSLGIGYKF